MHGTVTHSGQIMSASTSPSSVFDFYKQHCSSDRVHTELYLLETLRSVYPDRHITAVAPVSLDFAAFAAAGLADSKLVLDGDNLVRLRTYTPPQGRLDPGDGVLGQRISFAEYRYTLAGEAEPYTLFFAQWPDQTVGIQSFWYILTSKSSLDPITQHCAAADRLITAVGKWSARLHNEVYIFDAGCWHKSAALYSAIQSASWTDVILSERMKSTLIRDVADFFQRREMYARFGVPWKRGIILHGAPGCGKTISIKALMRSMQADHDVAGLYVKSLASQQGLQHSVQQIFLRARLMAPCLLIFEDLDSLVTDEVRSYFLNEVDGLEANTGILMIGSTNHLSRLDPAIAKRPSRFDRKYHFALPATQERKAYCAYWRGKILAGGDEIEFPEEICEVVAEMTEGFSFAYLKELFVQTLLTVVGGREAEDEEGEDDDDEAGQEAAAATAARVAVTAEQTIAAEGSAGPLQPGESLSSAALPTATSGDSNNIRESTAEVSSSATQAALPARAEVIMPPHLQDNTLLRIIIQQHRALRREMDSTSNDSAGVHARPKVASTGTAMGRVRQGRKMLVRLQG